MLIKSTKSHLQCNKSLGLSADIVLLCDVETEVSDSDALVLLNIPGVEKVNSELLIEKESKKPSSKKE